jgi:hypothetical protein
LIAKNIHIKAIYDRKVPPDMLSVPSNISNLGHQLSVKVTCSHLVLQLIRNIKFIRNGSHTGTRLNPRPDYDHSHAQSASSTTYPTTACTPHLPPQPQPLSPYPPPHHDPTAPSIAPPRTVTTTAPIPSTRASNPSTSAPTTPLKSQHCI